MNATEERELIPIGEVARRLRKHEQTIRRMEERGELVPVMRINAIRVYDAADVARLLN